MTKRTSLKKGFTLIELLVVISIIGVFAATTIVSLASVRLRAKDAKVEQEIGSIILALQTYEIEHGGYPNPGSGIYCIGASDCMLAGTSVGTIFPQNISMTPSQNNQLAAIFQTFSSGSIALDDSNKGYMYLSCGEGATCASNTAYLIYPVFRDGMMVSAPIGSFVSESSDWYL